ncbi:hypothetical protein RB653_000625 [Dictyostelium firmibasis]|uniref:Uncharacterized protein n=1 Tax=Dictyostelium firmibasis TaxID=79012 RepID=A0AAN7U666_9MYCE
MKINTKFFSILFFAISLLTCVPNVTSQTLSTTITLIVDFSSSTSYINNQCGGILVSGDTTVYPPCKSFKDAGNRARQYLNSGLAIPNSNSLTINVINTLSSPSISGESAQLGNLFGFCIIDILSTLSTSHAIADGTLSTSNFISLEEPTIPNNTYICSNGKLLRIRYIDFINWGKQTIIYTNINQIFNSYTKQTITLGFVLASYSNSIINVQPKGGVFEYGSVIFTSSSCSFSNIASSSSLPPLSFTGTNVNILATRFQYCTLNSSPFIYSNSGLFNMKLSSVVDSNIINNGYPFVKTLNVGDNFFYNNVNITNNIFSKFLLHQNDKINTPPSSTILHLFSIIIENNIITTDKNDPTNSFFSFQNYQGDSYTLSFQSLYSRENLILGNKSFISNQHSNITYRLSDLPSCFPIGMNTEYSYTEISGSNIDSNIPFAGNNSIFSYLTGGIFSIANTSNYDYCSSCLIIVDQDIKYNTL